jgi:pyruvate-formate lyase-activating enzyme
MKKTLLAVVADDKGEVFEHPELLLAGMNGGVVVRPRAEELIPLPQGSRLFTVAGAPAVGFDPRSGRAMTIDRLPKRWGGTKVQAVSAFLTPGFTRTLLPAADYRGKRAMLPLWSYTAVGWCVEEGRFYVAAVQVDRNQQWRPEHFDDRELDPLVRRRLAEQPDNRLLEQLARCAIDYHCFAAKNLFFRRWEAPLPVSPACNARCIGCISMQEADCCPASQERLTFVPTVNELCEVAVPHLAEAEHAIVSFGQGCEGDPILQADTVCAAVAAMRRATRRGTINFNSNASLPDAIDRLAVAGIDSLRVSLNSAQEHLYNVYYRQRGYTFGDVREALRRAKRGGLFTMLNYLVFPGVSDQRAEVDALKALIGEIGIDLVQMRNLSLDPALYLDTLGLQGRGIGMVAMLRELKTAFPQLQYGYFNRTREDFFPPGYQTDWPIDSN